jgi:hypothetical protein
MIYHSQKVWFACWLWGVVLKISAVIGVEQFFLASTLVKMYLITIAFGYCRCGNVASILELDEHLGQEYKVFQHAPSVCSSHKVAPISFPLSTIMVTVYSLLRFFCHTSFWLAYIRVIYLPLHLIDHLERLSIFESFFLTKQSSICHSFTSSL